jgi:UPF0176 protein
MFTVAALYQFADFPDFAEWQKPLQALCRQHGIKGTLLLASEGINGTIAGLEEGIDAILTYLKSDPRFSKLEHKVSYASEMPFYRMKVRLKKEIVTLGVSEVNPGKQVGTYVKPNQWNQLILDPDVIVLDTRNIYEYEIGTFQGAVNPNTKTFREFPEFVQTHLDPNKHKKVAMFCTGGIRCEKASSYMLMKGFEEVYHLEGGILKYLEEVPESESLWQGECFVFDQRVAVKHGLEEGDSEMCFGCRHPLNAKDKQSNKFQEGISCPHCYDHSTLEQKQRAAERQFQVELAQKRQQTHLGSH